MTTAADAGPAGASGWIGSLRAALSEELPAAVALRHALHAEPELSGHEQRTAARVAAALGQPGADDVSGGRLIRIGDADGPVIAVRAELDALPIAEDTAVAWAVIEATARATATAYECTAEAGFTEGEPVLRNDARLAAVTEPELEAAGLRITVPLRSCGSDDFSYYCSRYASLMMFVGVGPGPAGAPGLHHPSFLPPDGAVADVARVMLAGYLGACTAAGDRHHGSGGMHPAMP